MSGSIGTEYLAWKAKGLGFEVGFERTADHELKVRVWRGGYPDQFRTAFTDLEHETTDDVARIVSRLIGELLWSGSQ